MRSMILICLLALAACSDDAAVPDMGPGPGWDCSCAADLLMTDLTLDAPAVDGPAVDGPAVDTRLDGQPPDSAPDLAPDLAPALDAAGSKLIEYAQCSTNTTCKPYCGAIGSKSEGWFDGCTNQLLKHPTTGVPYWDQCAKCTVSCDAVGSYSEGWYGHCP